MNSIRHYTKKDKIVIALLTGAALSATYTGLIAHTYEHTAQAETKDTAPIARAYPNPFHDLQIDAKAAYVLDATTGNILYQKNAQEILPLASITKVMTALVAAENKLPQDTIAINPDAMKTEGDNGLAVNERWTLADLLDFTLIESSNDGAAAIAMATHGRFNEEMNNLGKKIGLKNSTFINETGLDINEQTPGAFGTAEDVAVLFSYIIKNYPHLLEATKYDHLTFTSLDGMRHTAKNTNTELGGIPNIIASKTGYTLLAGGNLAVAFDAGINRPVVIAVLGSSYEGRFDDVKNLASTTLSYFSVVEK